MNINHFCQTNCSLDAKLEDRDDPYENEQDGFAKNIVESHFLDTSDTAPKDVLL